MSTLGDLSDNPLVAWALRRSRREPRAIGLAVLYLLIVHGALLLFLTLMAAPGFGFRFREFTFACFMVSWFANAFLFLLFVPVRYAQALGFEREKRTLDFLRLTRVPARKICIGHIAAAYQLPVYVALTSSLEIFLGLFSRDAGYVFGVVQAYAGLIASSLIATSVAGLLAFLPKKGSQAAGGAFFAMLLLGFTSAAYQAPFFEPFGCLGPVGGMASALAHGGRETFVVRLFGATVPGVLLQVPVAVALALIFIDATTRKIADDGPGVLGFKAAARLAALVAIVAVVTMSDQPAFRSYWNYDASPEPPSPMIAGRLMVLLLACLPLAADSAVHREEVVRGLARAPRPPRPDERLSPRWPIVALVLIVLATTGLLAVQVERKDALAALVAGAVTASALAAVHAIFQASRLFFSIPVRNVMATVGVAALWFVPLVGTWGSNALGMPSFVVAIPSQLCPFVSITMSAVANHPRFASTSSGLDPLALGLVAVLLNILVACGLFALLRELVARLHEFAASLAVLPADVFSPAGKMDRRCENGHVFSGVWDRCPHCPAQASPKSTSAPV